MRLTPIIFAAGALVAYTIISKGGALQRLNFFPGAIKGFRFEGINPVVKVGLTIQNTSNNRLQVRSFAGNVYSNNTLIGNVSSYTALMIPALGEVVYLIDMKLMPLGIVNNIIAAIQGQGKQKIELDGYANVDHFQVPINVKYSIG